MSFLVGYAAEAIAWIVVVVGFLGVDEECRLWMMIVGACLEEEEDYYWNEWCCCTRWMDISFYP